MFHAAGGRYRVALAVAERFYSLAAKSLEPNDQLVRERFIGITRHFLGDLLGARRHIERVIAEYGSPEHRPHILRFQFDQRVTATAIFGHILWLQGFPDQAVRAAERAVDGARATGHAMSLCYSLALAGCPIALSVGDLAAAERYIAMLLEHSTKLGLARWPAFGLCHQGALVIKRGDLKTGLGLLRAGLDEFGETRSAFGYVKFRGTLASALNDAGQVAEGLAAIGEALQQVEHTEERWPIAEFLRIKGELVLSQGATAAAEEHFRQALDWARRQGALSWELRAAMSLAQLRRDQGRPADGLAFLQPVYERFTEGFEATDLKAAKALINAV